MLSRNILNLNEALQSEDGLRYDSIVIRNRLKCVWRKKCNQHLMLVITCIFRKVSCIVIIPIISHVPEVSLLNFKYHYSKNAFFCVCVGILQIRSIWNKCIFLSIISRNYQHETYLNISDKDASYSEIITVEHINFIIRYVCIRIPVCVC